MKYAILVYETPEDFAKGRGPEAEAYFGSYMAYHQALQEAGVYTGGHGLQPPTTATTVRLKKGDRVVQDGPFADVKEQLGGMFVIDVPDLDTALEWAAKCPSASTGSAEVRPLMEMEQ
ncbi:MAG: YciI family protein [Candidatus Eisenbacteria bacterium]|uniref:YciI family protein n=1 Tax=Eiseniibacteriota bacterium TaxID=2212470 RepID=A0A7Y2H3G4_UNCEI|nr:YciI family protein [Candidatus Eisenbacteria bacterium]